MFGKISLPGKQSTPGPAPKQQPKHPYPKHHPIAKKDKKNKKTNPIHNSLKGSKFRVLNQLLYTRPSTQSLQYFKQHQQDFETYHQGFREQASKWSQNPLDSIIAYTKKHHSNPSKLILDLGCGDAVLHEQLGKVTNVRSFDLVAKREWVEVADIADLPVGDRTADVAVFCLSLMGVNYVQFLREARRVLKETGELLIAEVESRCKMWQYFVKMVECLGFECKVNKTNQYFRLLYFKVNPGKMGKLKIQGQFQDIDEFSRQILGSCLYKKR